MINASNATSSALSNRDDGRTSLLDQLNTQTDSNENAGTSQSLFASLLRNRFNQQPQGVSFLTSTSLSSFQTIASPSLSQSPEPLRPSRSAENRSRDVSDDENVQSEDDIDRRYENESIEPSPNTLLARFAPPSTNDQFSPSVASDSARKSPTTEKIEETPLSQTAEKDLTSASSKETNSLPSERNNTSENEATPSSPTSDVTLTSDVNDRKTTTSEDGLPIDAAPSDIVVKKDKESVDDLDQHVASQAKIDEQADSRKVEPQDATLAATPIVATPETNVVLTPAEQPASDVELTSSIDAPSDDSTSLTTQNSNNSLKLQEEPPEKPSRDRRNRTDSNKSSPARSELQDRLLSESELEQPNANQTQSLGSGQSDQSLQDRLLDSVANVKSPENTSVVPPAADFQTSANSALPVNNAAAIQTSNVSFSASQVASKATDNVAISAASGAGNTGGGNDSGSLNGPPGQVLASSARNEGATTIRTVGATPQAGEAAELTSYQQGRLLQRVLGGLERLQDGTSLVRLRLHPAELGSLQLSLQVSEGSISANITAESDTAAQVLRDNLPQLHTKLAEQGIRIDKFEVQTQDRQSFAQQQFADLGNGSSNQNNDQGSQSEKRNNRLTAANSNNSEHRQNNVDVLQAPWQRRIDLQTLAVDARA